MNFCVQSSEWNTSLIASLEEAKKSKKPVFVDLYADWCAYCKVLKEKVFPDPIVDQSLKKFVLVRIDGEEFPNLMEHYDLKGYPSLLILDPNTIMIHKMTGFATKEMVVEFAEKSLRKFEEEQENQKIISKEPTNTSALYKLGNYYYKGGDPDKAKTYFEQAIQSPDPATPEIKMNSTFNLGLALMDLEEYETSVQVWKEYLLKFPDSKDSASVHYFLGSSYSQLGKKPDAKLYFKKALSQNPSPSLKQKIEFELRN